MMPQGEAVNSIQWRWREDNMNSGPQVPGIREGTVMKIYETKPIFRKLFLFLSVGCRTVALTSLYQLDCVDLRPSH
jgi:hypothetical protein